LTDKLTDFPSLPVSGGDLLLPMTHSI